MPGGGVTNVSFSGELRPSFMDADEEGVASDGAVSSAAAAAVAASVASLSALRTTVVAAVVVVAVVVVIAAAVDFAPSRSSSTGASVHLTVQSPSVGRPRRQSPSRASRRRPTTTSADRPPSWCLLLPPLHFWVLVLVLPLVVLVLVLLVARWLAGLGKRE